MSTGDAEAATAVEAPKHAEADRSRSRDPSRQRHRDDRGDREERRSKRSRSRSRTRSRSRRRDRSRDRHRDRSYDRHRHRDRRDTGRRDTRDTRRYTDRRERAPKRDATPPHERELRELDRDTRTVFAFNLNLKASEKELFQFFVTAGPIVDIKIIRDRTTGRGKGFAYIEYQHKESVIRALALTGQPLMGQAVMVKMSEAEKNLAWEAAEQQKQQNKAMEAQYGPGAAAAMAVGALSGPGLQSLLQQAMLPAAPGAAPTTGPTQLLVSNIHPSLSETELRPIFEPFCSPGAVLAGLTIQRDAAGRSMGLAHVHFTLGADAHRAAQQLDNFDLCALKLRVQVLAPQFDAAAAAGLVVGGLDERLDADATDGGGLKLTAQSRVALMSRLAANTGMEVPQMPQYGIGGLLQPGGGAPGTNGAGGGAMTEMALDQGVLGPASPIPTQCLLLKNMFDPAEETAPDWDQEIAGDVREECSKYGPVTFVHVDRDSKGFVYVKFGGVESASTAQKALHGRWFAGKQIVADYQFTSVFNSHFML